MQFVVAFVYFGWWLVLFPLDNINRTSVFNQDGILGKLGEEDMVLDSIWRKAEDFSRSSISLFGVLK